MRIDERGARSAVLGLVKPHRAFRPSRRGSFFAIVLIVLFILTVVLFGLQYLSVDTIRQTRMLLESAGAPCCADVVFHPCHPSPDAFSSFRGVQEVLGLPA